MLDAMACSRGGERAWMRRGERWCSASAITVRPRRRPGRSRSRKEKVFTNPNAHVRGRTPLLEREKLDLVEEGLREEVPVSG